MDMVRASFNRKIPMGSAARNRTALTPRDRGSVMLDPVSARFKFPERRPCTIRRNEFGDGGLISGSNQKDKDSAGLSS